MSRIKIDNFNISDHQANIIVEIGKKFYSNPDNVNAYREWHKNQYGEYPTDGLCAVNQGRCHNV